MGKSKDSKRTPALVFVGRRGQVATVTARMVGGIDDQAILVIPQSMKSQDALLVIDQFHASAWMLGVHLGKRAKVWDALKSAADTVGAEQATVDVRKFTPSATVIRPGATGGPRRASKATRKALAMAEQTGYSRSEKSAGTIIEVTTSPGSWPRVKKPPSNASR